MKKLILLGCIFAISAQAAIKIENSDNCQLKQQRITEFVVAKDDKTLSYRSDGKLYQLAQASSGVLVGRFRALMMGENFSNFDGKWLDITEIPLSEVEARKPKTIDQVFYYLPLHRALSPSDIGFDGNWRISTFVFDYNWHGRGVNGEKEWQFLLKNSRTGASNTVMARDAERQLLEKCRHAPNPASGKPV